MINRRICFLGAGNMAEAIMSSLIENGLFKHNDIFASDIRSDRLITLKAKYKINISNSNLEAVKKCDIVVLSVKPKDVAVLLSEIYSGINKSSLIISIAAGITIKNIQDSLPSKVPIIRTMPNTPLMVNCGAIAMAKNRWASSEDITFAEKIFLSSGIVVHLPENQINAVTALSGSGPAYIFYICEAMEAAGEQMGLKNKVADKLSKQTILGAAKMLTESGLTAEELRRRVTSPGGTTEAAINVLEKKRFKNIFIEALEKAKTRASQLSCR